MSRAYAQYVASRPAAADALPGTDSRRREPIYWILCAEPGHIPGHMPLAMTASERSRGRGAMSEERGALEQRLRSAHARTTRFEAVLQRRRMFFCRRPSYAWSSGKSQLVGGVESAALSLQPPGHMPSVALAFHRAGPSRNKSRRRNERPFLSFDSKSARCLGNKNAQRPYETDPRNLPGTNLILDSDASTASWASTTLRERSSGGTNL